MRREEYLKISPTLWSCTVFDASMPIADGMEPQLVEEFGIVDGERQFGTMEEGIKFLVSARLDFIESSLAIKKRHLSKLITKIAVLEHTLKSWVVKLLTGETLSSAAIDLQTEYVNLLAEKEYLLGGYVPETLAKSLPDDLSIPTVLPIGSPVWSIVRPNSWDRGNLIMNQGYISNREIYYHAKELGNRYDCELIYHLHFPSADSVNCDRLGYYDVPFGAMYNDKTDWQEMRVSYAGKSDGQYLFIDKQRATEKAVAIIKDFRRLLEAMEAKMLEMDRSETPVHIISSLPKNSNMECGG